MTKTRSLSGKALQLLFEALEATEAAVMTGAATRQYGPELQELCGARLISQEGHAAAVADDDDRPRDLIWSPEAMRYGYFSEADGWIFVADNYLQSFAADTEHLIKILTAKFGLSHSSGPKQILPGQLWDVGAARFGGRPKRNQVFFTRRLHDVQRCLSVQRAMQRTGLTERAVLLTSTASDRIAQLPNGCEVVSACEVLRSGGGLEIDPDAIAVLLSGRPPKNSNDLEVIADGREVRFFNETFSFKKGLRQREIIRFLQKKLNAGQHWVSSAEILAELEFSHSTRIRDIFKGNRAWGRLLIERGGMCGFCFDSHKETREKDR